MRARPATLFALLATLATSSARADETKDACLVGYEQSQVARKSGDLPMARQELRIALDVWMERVPDFSLVSEDTDDVRWSLGQVRGPRTLPVTINR